MNRSLFLCRDRHKLRQSLCRLVGIACLIASTPSSELSALELSDARIERLDNGLTVLLLEDRTFPVVSVQMLYRVGGRNESYGQSGIAHFLEHMAFRDTASFPDTGVVSSIYAAGGEWHGYTWIDQTTYFATVPREELDLLLRIESDRMHRLELAIEDIEAERGAVLAEMHGYENDPATVLHDAVVYTVFFGHPYRNNTIGWESDIRQLRHRDVLAFYRQHYRPANAVLAIVGDMNTEATLHRIHDLFARIPRGEPTPLPHTIEPVQHGERRVQLLGQGDRKHFKLAWQAPPVTSADFPAFLVLQDLLGAGSGVNFLQNDWGTTVGEGSPLHAVDAAITSWFHPSAQPYVYTISGSVDTDAAEPQIEAAIDAAIRALRESSVSERQIEQAKSRVLDELAFDVETTEDAAHQLAYFAGLDALDVLFGLAESVRRVEAVEIRALATRYLDPEQRTIGWWLPSDKERGAAGLPSSRSTLTSRSPDSHGGPGEPAGAPLLRRLGGGIPVIVQTSRLSAALNLQVVLPTTQYDYGPAALADSPVLGHTALNYRLRPGELGAAVEASRRAIDNARPSPVQSASPPEDPSLRLEAAFAAAMAPVPVRHDAAPGPTVIVVSGAVDPGPAIATLDAAYGNMAVSAAVPVQRPAKPAEDTSIRIGRRPAQASLGYLTRAAAPSSPAFHAWQILQYIFSHDYEGRFGKEAISRRGLAYFVDSAYRSDGHGAWISLAVGVDPEKFAALDTLLRDELERLRSEPPVEAEVEEAKSHLLGRALSRAQSNRELADALARHWIWHGELISHQTLALALAATTRQDVLAAISEFTAGSVISVR